MSNAITSHANILTMASYSVNSRHVQRVQLDQLEQAMAAIQYAIDMKNGTRIDRTLGGYRTTGGMQP
jgi:hypothetical protein